LEDCLWEKEIAVHVAVKSGEAATVKPVPARRKRKSKLILNRKPLSPCGGGFSPGVN